MNGQKEQPVAYTRSYAASTTDVGKEYTWSAEIPPGWEMEWVAPIEAINLYNPTAEAESNLERSQIFMRYFEANQFLTLQTVTIHTQTNLTVNDRPAVVYDIEKNSGVADFANQPSWRSERHNVTDVRASDDNPSIFYVIAKRPDLDQDVYNHFLETFRVIDSPSDQGVDQHADVIEPVDNFRTRVTKKPFGLYVTPDTSPVSPERFSGYHSGADAEFSDTESEVEVRAIANGTVKLANTVSGYGGVVVIEHVIKETTYQVIYGHLDPNDLPTVGEEMEQNHILIICICRD